MQSKGFDKRMRVLEGNMVAQQRRTLPGLVRLVESGTLTVHALTDEELERIVIGVPGEDMDMRHLSDDELIAIINGVQP